MKKIYKTPFVIMEEIELSTVMTTQSGNIIDYGGGNTGGEGGLIMQVKYDGFGSFDYYEEDEDD